MAGVAARPLPKPEHHPEVVAEDKFHLPRFDERRRAWRKARMVPLPSNLVMCSSHYHCPPMTVLHKPKAPTDSRGMPANAHSRVSHANLHLAYFLGGVGQRRRSACAPLIASSNRHSFSAANAARLAGTASTRLSASARRCGQGRPPPHNPTSSVAVGARSSKPEASEAYKMFAHSRCASALKREARAAIPCNALRTLGHNSMAAGTATSANRYKAGGVGAECFAPHERRQHKTAQLFPHLRSEEGVDAKGV